MAQLIQVRAAAAIAGVVLSVVAIVSEVAAQVGPPTVYESFLAAVSTEVLRQPSPVEDKTTHTWTGIVFAEPGTALSPIIAAYDCIEPDYQSVRRMLENISAVDRPFHVSDGFAQPLPITIDTVWERVLEQTMPTSRIPAGMETDEVGRWLYRQPDAVDTARGTRFLREPSEYFQRYQEYQELYNLLVAADLRGDVAWRLEPRLNRFTSVKDAKRAIREDWVKFGYKIEVESASAAFASRSVSEAWGDWLDAKNRFSLDRISIEPGRLVERTFLSPPATAWLDMGLWRFATISVGVGKGNVSFQWARVEIARPWLAINDLLSGRLKFRSGTNFTLSDGLTPTLSAYPEGNMAVVPTALLLVRNIAFSSADGKDSGHPLAKIAYPDSTNLLGYVVYALPKIP